LLKSSAVQYSPKYQRGFQKKLGDLPDGEQWFDQLFSVSDPNLLIDPRRCDEMAVRWLYKDMTNRDLEWNLRKSPLDQPPQFKDYKLHVFSPATIPDSGHRHRAIYTLVRWKLEPKLIPDEVIVDHKPITKAEILKRLESYDLKTTMVTVKIHNVAPKTEGKIFYQANNLTRPAEFGAGHDIYPGQTPESRFVQSLMKRSPVLAEEQIERRSSRIAGTSRKATTLSTLIGAASSMMPRLASLEDEKTKYNNLVDFYVAFFDEYANLFSEWQPNTPADERWESRCRSYAIHNIMVHPLFSLAWDFWQEMERKHVDWREAKNWKDALAACRSADRAAEEVRAGDQSKNGKADRRDHSAKCAGESGQGYQVIVEPSDDARIELYSPSTQSRATFIEAVVQCNPAVCIGSSPRSAGQYLDTLPKMHLPD
jgi:DNA-sulfur modification-associated